MARSYPCCFATPRRSGETQASPHCNVLCNFRLQIRWYRAPCRTSTMVLLHTFLTKSWLTYLIPPTACHETLRLFWLTRHTLSCQSCSRAAGE